MAIRPILTLPDPVLRRRCEPVEQVDKGVRALVADMFETMYMAPGVGLAAIQIGVPKRIAVIDVAGKDDKPQPIALINPEIVETSEELAAYEEGCLSIPDYYEEVIRPARCRVRYLDEKGETRELEADGILAVCVQHEIDHLDGKLFIDHLSRLKRELIVRKFRNAAKRGEMPAAPVKRTPRERREPRPVSAEDAAQAAGLRD
jgi:peptide deformylase